MKILTILILILSLCQLAVCSEEMDPQKNEAMDIKTFVDMTSKIIAENGFDSYCPTLVLYKDRSVKVLDGVPDISDKITSHRKITEDWIKRVNPPKPYCTAFIDSKNRIVAMEVRENGEATVYNLDRKDGKLISYLVK